MENDGAKDSGLEPPSPMTIFFIVVMVGLATLLICASIGQRLRRSRSTRTLIARMTNRLRSSGTSEESRHPAAQPSKYMKRFAGVSVVNANAIVDEVHYERLREFPQSFAEVSDVATNVDSADFSASEAATSVYSRSGHRFTNSRTHSVLVREGSCTSEPSPQIENSYAEFPSLMVDPEEMSGAHYGEEDAVEGADRRVGHIHCVPPTANIEGVNGNDTNAEEDEFGHQPMSRVRTTATPRFSRKDGDCDAARNTTSPLALSPAQRTSAGTFGRCVINNISVEDLAAHCAALQDDEDDAIDAMAEGDAKRRSVGDCSGSHVDADGDGTATSAAATKLHPARERPTTPLTPYTFIMREKTRRAREGGARSVVVVEPELSSDSSGSNDTASSLSQEGRDGTAAVAPAAASSSARKAEENAEERVGDAAMSARRSHRRVRREHHRHHTSKGGFIVCEDFVPDIASRRMRRQQTNAKKPKFIFQLRDEDELYGRAQYHTQPSNEEREEES